MLFVLEIWCKAKLETDFVRVGKSRVVLLRKMDIMEIPVNFLRNSITLQNKQWKNN